MYVNIDKLRSNLLRIKRSVGVKTFFMVKADAYGHGLCEVAQAVEDIVDGYGVAVLEEGLSLRACGIKKPVLLLICPPDELIEAINHGISVCIGDETQLAALENAVSDGIISADQAKIHIAVDTGMHRLGFEVGAVDATLKRLCKIGISAEGVYSHLRVRSQKQIKAFDRACNIVRAYCPNALRHIASSHSAGCKTLRYDAVRVGLYAYEGAMRIESKVIAARRVAAGEFVSYGSFKLSCDTNTAVVFGGYADGVQRENPSAVYIRGRECRVLGKVCMDMCVVDCGDFLPDIGEKVVLSDAEKIKRVSKMRRSVEYTAMTCWRGRIERIYEYDKGRSEDSLKKGDC